MLGVVTSAPSRGCQGWSEASQLLCPLASGGLVPSLQSFPEEAYAKEGNLEKVKEYLEIMSAPLVLSSRSEEEPWSAH